MRRPQLQFFVRKLDGRHAYFGGLYISKMDIFWGFRKLTMLASCSMVVLVSNVGRCLLERSRSLKYLCCAASKLSGNGDIRTSLSCFLGHTSVFEDFGCLYSAGNLFFIVCISWKSRGGTRIDAWLVFISLCTCMYTSPSRGPHWGNLDDRSSQWHNAHTNEIKHDHSPVVIVVLDSSYG